MVLVPITSLIPNQAIQLIAVKLVSLSTQATLSTQHVADMIKLTYIIKFAYCPTKIPDRNASGHRERDPSSHGDMKCFSHIRGTPEAILPDAHLTGWGVVWRNSWN